MSEPTPEILARDHAWDEFLASQPEASFMQSSWWAAFMVTLGWGHFGAVIQDGETIVGGAQVLTSVWGSSHRYYYVPEGPVISPDETDVTEVFEHVMAYIERHRAADDHRVSHLRIEPRWHTLPPCVGAFRQSRGWMEPRSTLYIDLRPDEMAILAQMKPKGRYNIGVARKHGVAIVDDASARGIDDFQRIYRETVARHALSGAEAAYFDRLIPMLSAVDRGTVLFAEYEGQRIATVLVIYFGGRATYLWGGSLAAQRHVMAPYLLHFEVMHRAKARGCLWYDMYGIAPLNEPDHPWANLSTFKRKLGGHDVRFVPTLDYIYDAAAYEHYRERRRSRRRTRGIHDPSPQSG